MRVRDLPTFALITAAAIAARLPFLLRADRFFDADEAVEGLMARHLGDHSLFLWGQRYKGTPEVVLTGALFHVAGPGVIALKAVTLACFVVFLCVNFRLLERVLSRGVAWMATAFFIAGPPSLVLWTLSGSAEIVMTMLVGSVLLLAVLPAPLKGSPCKAAYVAAFALGVGLWIQQYILYYVVSLLIAAAVVTPEWRGIARDTIRARMPGWLRGATAALLAAGSFYVVLGLIPFFMIQVHVTVAGLPIAVTNPQKMWWLAGTLFAGAALVAIVAIFRERLIAPALAFLTGYSPAIIGRIGNHGLGAPISRLDLSGLRHALPDITTVMLPIFAGWRDPVGSPTVSPWLALVPLLLVVISYWSAWRRRLNPVFHLFPLVAGALFLASGSYIDAQSYRYLMPIYAALPVVYAVGVHAAWNRSRIAGTALLMIALSVFAAQQIDWYSRLQPDLVSARAPYWQSYTVTFLTGERIIVSPLDGVDRYAPFAEQTRNAPLLESVLASCR